MSGLSPSSGPVGTPVTITGTNLTGATAVDFGSTAAASYTVNSPTSITTTAPAAPSSPSASYSAVGSVVSGTGNGKASLAFTSKAAGDAIVLSIAIEADVTVTGVTDTAGVTWQRLHADQVDTSTSPDQVVSLWLGTVTTAGAMTIDVAYSASVSATAIDIAAQEFSAGLGSNTIWSVGPAGAQNNAASTTIAFPSLTPSSGTALGVWWVDCANSGSGTSSGTMHFTTDSVGDLFAYDTAVTGATAPSATQTSGFSVAIGALITASAPASAVDVTVTTPGGTSATSPADQFTYTGG
ncbi:MAG TPA: IPT/TIG domain-containing protein [Acidimicrobiales bacterium]|nr:IPT/TIG domain-containing protein [Acidimicrobiales bacterium]